MPLKAKYKNGRISITFNNYTRYNSLTANGEFLREFSMDGINECKAKIQNKKVEIEVKEMPAYVYYV